MDYTPRYPELAIVQRLPPGTIVDGELVVGQGGMPDFAGLLARHQLRAAAKIHHAGRNHPVTYVVFDVLETQGRSLLGQPLLVRREILRYLVDQLREPRLVFSEGVIDSGRAFFDQAVRQGQEGVMAKHLASRYAPGRRSAAWQKIKPAFCLPCVIVGFVPGREGLRHLHVAACRDGDVGYVATLQAGFTSQARAQLPTLLQARVCSRPFVACSARGVWVEPGLYCQVRFLAWTRGGRLLGASFRGLLDPPINHPPG